MKIYTKMKVGATGKYKTIEIKELNHSGSLNDYADAIGVIERNKNNGLLAQEAELIYPKSGLHNKPIYKIVVKNGANKEFSI